MAKKAIEMKSGAKEINKSKLVRDAVTVLQHDANKDSVSDFIKEKYGPDVVAKFDPAMLSNYVSQERKRQGLPPMRGARAGSMGSGHMSSNSIDYVGAVRELKSLLKNGDNGDIPAMIDTVASLVGTLGVHKVKELVHVLSD